jgi:hypothetical protein
MSQKPSSIPITPAVGSAFGPKEVRRQRELLHTIAHHYANSPPIGIGLLLARFQWISRELAREHPRDETGPPHLRP